LTVIKLMKIYTLSKTQRLPISIQEAWAFFSNPRNLAVITPPHMKFDIQYMSGGNEMYEGQIIRYKIQVLPGITSGWVTEIKNVRAPFSFIDEQRFGPYALWHHQHRFKEIDGGIEMTDEVNYAIPLGLLGRFAHWLFVERELKRIFEYRIKKLEELFGK